jgi:hypothetical protein
VNDEGTLALWLARPDYFPEGYEPRLATADQLATGKATRERFLRNKERWWADYFAGKEPKGPAESYDP